MPVRRVDRTLKASAQVTRERLAGSYSRARLIRSCSFAKAGWLVDLMMGYIGCE